MEGAGALRTRLGFESLFDRQDRAPIEHREALDRIRTRGEMPLREPCAGRHYEGKIVTRVDASWPRGGRSNERERNEDEPDRD